MESRNGVNLQARREVRLVLIAIALLIFSAVLFARLAMGQTEPAPQLVSPGWVDTITRPIINFVGAHPWTILLFAVALCTVTGLRTVWPIRSERPKWVAFAIGFSDPFCLNFWGAIRWVAAKTGFPIWTPKDDQPTGGGTALPDPNALPKAGDP